MFILCVCKQQRLLARLHGFKGAYSGVDFLIGGSNLQRGVSFC